MAKKDTVFQAEVTARAMEADPFDQPYWNLDQYLIWLASRDPAAVLNATDRRPNAGTTPPLAWRVYEESNVDRQKVEMEAIRAIKGGCIKACVEFKGKWFTPDDPEWFAPKRYGYGTGMPISWQGWAMTIGYLLMVAGLAFALARRPLVLIAAIILPTVAFLVLSAKTTRGGWRWRWGEKD